MNTRDEDAAEIRNTVDVINRQFKENFLSGLETGKAMAALDFLKECQKWDCGDIDKQIEYNKYIEKIANDIIYENYNA